MGPGYEMIRTGGSQGGLNFMGGNHMNQMGVNAITGGSYGFPPGLMGLAGLNPSAFLQQSQFYTFIKHPHGSLFSLIIFNNFCSHGNEQFNGRLYGNTWNERRS